MKCSKCGKEIEEGKLLCDECSSLSVEDNNEKKASFWWFLTGLAEPVIALVLWLVFKKKFPKVSKLCKISFIVWLIVYVTLLVIIMTIFIICGFTLLDGIKSIFENLS